ncbi:DUF4238 domain-containing protein [Altererythrobacter fulvus]|uniref:DUF4238 domain-containing protein n=1 Tax=Caenibius fulvus TaxID=2126012 RepID=UPI0030171E23
MADEHRNQHWIPEVYSRAWCDPNRPGIIHRYNSDGKYVDWRPVKRVFSQDDLYTIYGEAGERDVRVETEFLHARETAFGRIRPKLENGDELTEIEHAELLIFVASLHRRSPEARDHWQRFMDQVLKVGDDMDRHLKALPPDERREVAKGLRSISSSNDSTSISLEDWRKKTAAQFGEWLPNHMFIEAKAMTGMGMVVLQASADAGQFITSDSPVTWWDYENPPGHRLGIGHPTIEVTLPISPSTCILFRHGDAGTYQLNAEGVAEINHRTLHGCREFFIANSPNVVVEWHQAPR